MLALKHADDTKDFSQQIGGLSEERLHLLRVRAGGDVNVLAFALHQVVADRTAGKVGGMSGRAKRPNRLTGSFFKRHQQ